MGTIIVSIVFIILFMYIYIRSIIIHFRYKEVEKRGLKIKGQVLELKYIRTRQLIKTGRCHIVVSCEIASEQKTFKTLSAVGNDDYSPGDEINLLFLDEYPKSIIIEGIPSTSKEVFAIFTIGIALIVIFMVYNIKEGYSDYKVNQEIRKAAYEFIRPLEDEK